MVWLLNWGFFAAFTDYLLLMVDEKLFVDEALLVLIGVAVYFD